ncbi:MAG TPA: hypothetical protein VMW31_06225, partial [Devosiaceae bacterium]|nr:hypothetical protein [Devosiaceae bacterium]
PEGETLLAVGVADALAELPAGWPSQAPYAIVSLIDSSASGTIGAAEFTAQFDFLANGLRDVSRLSPADADALVAETLASAGEPPRFDPGSALAIEGVQLLATPERGERAGAVTMLHPTTENALLVNDLGLINVNGQMIKVAVYAFLRDDGTVVAAQALGKAIRDATLGAN